MIGVKGINRAEADIEGHERHVVVALSLKSV